MCPSTLVGPFLLQLRCPRTALESKIDPHSHLPSDRNFVEGFLRHFVGKQHQSTPPAPCPKPAWKEFVEPAEVAPAGAALASERV